MVWSRSCEEVGNAQDLEHCGTVRTGTAWLTAAAATPVSYKLCTASYARTIKIYDLQVFPNRLEAACQPSMQGIAALSNTCTLPETSAGHAVPCTAIF